MLMTFPTKQVSPIFFVFCFLFFVSLNFPNKVFSSFLSSAEGSTMFLVLTQAMEYIPNSLLKSLHLIMEKYGLLYGAGHVFV